MTISRIEISRKIEYYGKEKELSNVSYKLYEGISDFYRRCINMHKAYDKDNAILKNKSYINTRIYIRFFINM